MEKKIQTALDNHLATGIALSLRYFNHSKTGLPFHAAIPTVATDTAQMQEGMVPLVRAGGAV